MDKARQSDPLISWVLEELLRDLTTAAKAAQKPRPAPAQHVELSLTPGVGLVIGAETPREKQAKRCNNRPERDEPGPAVF